MSTSEKATASLALVLAAIDDLDSMQFLYKGEPIELLNEAGSLDDTSVFYAAGFEFGPSVLIHVNAYRGDGFEPAYEAWIDSLPEIDKDELPEAYSDPRDPEERTFDDIARSRLADTYPDYRKREAWEAWHVELKALGLQLLQECAAAAHENGGENYPEIVEGYREDSSGKVKSLGHYETFYEADLADITITEKEADKPGIAKAGHAPSPDAEDETGQ